MLKTRQTCELCSEPVLQSDFYLFPCLHAFHAACLVNEVRTPAADVAAAHNTQVW